MNRKAKTAWLVNLGLVVLLAIAGVIFGRLQTPAAAAGWETGGILGNTTEDDKERLVLVNTQEKRILVYKTANTGQFRLVAARWYKFDMDVQDTSKLAEIEKDGASVLDLFEMRERARRARNP